MDFFEINERFGSLENYINIILIAEDIKLAFLLECIHSNDKTTNKILIETNKIFPELFFYFNYNKGVIISKQIISNNISYEEIEILLNYPFYENTETLECEELYFINIILSFLPFENEFQNSEKKICLFTNEFIDKNKINVLIVDKIKDVLNEQKYIYNIPEVKNIEIHLRKMINIEDLINKLIHEEYENGENEKNIITEDEKLEIEYILFKFGFSLETQSLFELYFQYTNPIHKGILFGLLINYRNNVLKPFHLNNNFKLQNEVLNIINNWEKDLITILQATIKE